MSLSHTVEAYLGRKPDFLNEILLQNDGAGDYIKEWGAVDKPEPTDSELESAKVEGDKIAILAEISNNRQAEYPAIGDQLDYIFHNGVAKWKTDMIEPVKAKYPKPS